ncbi:hypothetical protein CZ771_11590 [Actinomycetales bacterium JB111]|nr:hypothetical protein CZ771_11590 [Actinomycetales bacterium JB111]
MPARGRRGAGAPRGSVVVVSISRAIPDFTRSRVTMRV